MHQFSVLNYPQEVGLSVLLPRSALPQGFRYLPPISFAK